jgi:hypothetical protein
MQRLLAMLAIAGLALGSYAGPLAAQGCFATSGSATINDVAWTTQCVVGSTSPTCVDSLGNDYECFAIVGTSNAVDYQAVSIFLAVTPSQGQTYSLGGIGGGENGAMVVGQSGLWVTGDAPYTGSVEVTVYNPSSGTIECTFAFTAQGLFGGEDLEVTNGSFVGLLVPVSPTTWSDVKKVYR